MASHKITLNNGQVEGLNPEEMQTILNFAAKNQGVQKMIGQVAEKVQEAVSKDVISLTKFVEQGKVTREDAYLLMEEYFSLTDSLRTLREATMEMDLARMQEGVLDNVKDFGKSAYAKAGVAFTNATQAVGKAIGNILGWINRHPKLAAGLTVMALMVLLPAAAHASSAINLDLNHNGVLSHHEFYVTSGHDLGGLTLLLGDESLSPTQHEKVMDCLRQIGSNSVLVMPDGSHMTGSAKEILLKILHADNTNGMVLLSQNAIPATGGARLPKGILPDLLHGAIPIPGVN